MLVIPKRLKTDQGQTVNELKFSINDILMTLEQVSTWMVLTDAKMKMIMDDIKENAGRGKKRNS